MNYECNMRAFCMMSTRNLNSHNKTFWVSIKNILFNVSIIHEDNKLSVHRNKKRNEN